MTILRQTALLFIMLGLSISANGYVLDSATLDPTEINGSLSGGYNISNLSGTFSEDITFSVVGAPAVGISGVANVISIQFAGFFGVDNLSASLNGSPLSISAVFSFLNVGVLNTIFTNGDYTLTFAGTAFSNGAALSGNVAINSVPVPAAFWLFGSALVGLFGFRMHRKTS